MPSDRINVEDVQSFLAQVNHSSLFEYLGVSQTAPTEDLRAALARRRQWAQGQQANPKFRSEARWIIRNYRSLEALIADRDSYLNALRDRQRSQSLAELRELIDVTRELNLDASMLTLILYYAERKGIGLEQVVEQLTPIHGQWEVQLLVDEILDPDNTLDGADAPEDLLEEDDWGIETRNVPPDPLSDPVSLSRLSGFDIDEDDGSATLVPEDSLSLHSFSSDFDLNSVMPSPVSISDQDMWIALDRIRSAMGISDNTWSALRDGRVPPALVEPLVRMGRDNNLPFTALADMLRDVAEQHLRTIGEHVDPEADPEADPKVDPKVDPGPTSR
ncbi:MAG: hypothetical protein AAFV53_15505 [Myxococcota bacterium]